MTWNAAMISTVASRDGTAIGYYQLGSGPGLVLVQGTMGTAYNFKQLAERLAGQFTVYVPDRRGRGLSKAVAADIHDYRVQKEVEDLEALLAHTGAHFVFGLSAGALISLQAALTSTAIHKLAIFEPPLFLKEFPTALIQRYEQEAAQGKTGAAMVSAMLAAQMGPPIFSVLPRGLLEGMTNKMLAQDDKRLAASPGHGYPPMRELAGVLNYDVRVIREMDGALPRFKDVQVETLLLGGSKSPHYLKTALRGLEETLPHAQRIELPGVGHGAPWNPDRGGKPAVVAQALKDYFADRSAHA